MAIKIRASFNKQTKDSKKELIQFYLTGDDEKNPELNELCREVVELEIDGVESKLTAEFSKVVQDAKKTTLDFIVKGNSSVSQSYDFYRKAGSTVLLTIAAAQMSLGDYQQEPPHEGIEYTVNGDGTVETDPNQVSIDDVPPGDGDAPPQGTENVTDLQQARTRRGRPRKATEQEQKAEQAAPAADDADDLMEQASDEDLPF
ncbi:hypothetical protein SAMN02799630_02861 [Paenibacillus sp. UNCCL117]|uniref:hypothetical protein n=1 Tax=unclassified Paenibacillus TaxID=185978 RepID=UPI000883D307|nr:MULTISPECIES: hypothetical protein [unclassified Paenibacillus]SDD27655.1 hypothetical protein SAMN04488602_107130 [Paenibacillus sp. cl123]SFW41050.1 hypothetical protein SAMN02799630_02861 [Paenibacillus sp. UNCCL117]